MSRKREPARSASHEVFVLDSQALSLAVRGDSGMSALIKIAPREGIRVITSALTTIEAWDPRDSGRAPLWHWTLSRIGVVHTDDDVVTSARSLLKDAGLHGHKYAIDAVLAAVALAEARRGGEATVFTSDVDDLERLLSGHPVEVEKV